MRKSSLSLCLAALAASIATAQPGASPITEIDSYIAKAQDAIDMNHLAEAVRSYVAVLAIAEENPSPQAADKAKSANAELAKIGARLSLEPSSEWLDPKGAQIAGSSRGLGKEGGLSPSVYLFENFGTGKSPVGDAPIYFQFVKNSGSLVAFVATDAYGKANTTVAKLDEPGSDATIRAYPVFKSRGKSFAFASVFRDFAYLPPANAVKVLALESSEQGPSSNPLCIDPVTSVLKQTSLQVQPFNAILAPDAFMKAYGGNADSLAELGIGVASPYAAFVFVEVAPTRQMELNKKKYDIFTAAVTANFKLIRQDGSVVYSLPISVAKGQGGTPAAAIADSYRQARDAFGLELQKRLPEIKDALRKD